MVTSITQGIKVSVRVAYNADYPGVSTSQQHYLFSYNILIENESEYTIQLLRRKWNVFDSDGSFMQVEGDGVVGQQPILEPGTSYQYTSGCNLKTPVGKMVGVYTMQKLVGEEEFEVNIPEFTLVAPFMLN